MSPVLCHRRGWEQTLKSDRCARVLEEDRVCLTDCIGAGLLQPLSPIPPRRFDSASLCCTTTSITSNCSVRVSKVYLGFISENDAWRLCITAM